MCNKISKNNSKNVQLAYDSDRIIKMQTAVLVAHVIHFFRKKEISADDITAKIAYVFIVHILVLTEHAGQNHSPCGTSKRAGRRQ